MVPPEIERLFEFIEFLDKNKAEYIQYVPLCNELIELGHERDALSPDKNFNDRLLYKKIQHEFDNKFSSIIEKTYNPITEELRRLGIWSGDSVYSSIWNNSVDAIYRFQKEFTEDDVDAVFYYKKKYLNFRTDTNSNFLSLGLIFHSLDEILKLLFDYFKNTETNEFESFQSKKVNAASFQHMIKMASENLGKNIVFSLNKEVSSADKTVPHSRADSNLNETKQLDAGRITSSNGSKILSEKEVFVTYAWDDIDHQDAVYEFVNYLRSKGFHAEMDRYKSQQEASADFMKMMHQAMTDYKKVVVVLSKKYKEKAESFSGGVGTEYSLIIKDIQDNVTKYILVSADGHGNDVTPIAFRNRDIIDISRPYKDHMMNLLFAKLQDVVTVQFSPVAKNKPEIKIKTPRNRLDDELVIEEFNFIPGSSETREDQYSSIEYALHLLIKNVGINSFHELDIEIEVPTKICSHDVARSYVSEGGSHYREGSGRSYFTSNIARLSPGQATSSKNVHVEITNLVIDDVISDKVVVRVFTELKTFQREFEIRHLLRDHEGNSLDTSSFLTKYDRFRS